MESSKSSLQSIHQPEKQLSHQPEGGSLLWWKRFRHNVVEFSAFGIGHITFACAIAMLFYLLKNLKLRAKVIKQLLSFLQTYVNTSKIAILIVLKMVVVPILLGSLLEHSVRPLVVLSEPEYSDWNIFERPVLTVVRLWVFGITHMLVITVLLIQARDIFHRDILGHLIRPHDPNANFIQMLLSESVAQHARRLLVSVVIYAILIMLFSLLPMRMMLTGIQYVNCAQGNVSSLGSEGMLAGASAVQNLSAAASDDSHAMMAFKTLMSESFSFSYIIPVLQVPVELAVYHFIVLQHLDKRKRSIFELQKLILVLCATLFGLKSYLIPCPVSPGEQLYDSDCTLKESVELLPRQRPTLFYLRLVAFSVAWYLLSLMIMISVLLAPVFISIFLMHQLSFKLVHIPHVWILGCIVISQFYSMVQNVFIQVFQRFSRQLRTLQGVHVVCALAGSFLYAVAAVTLVLDMFAFPGAEASQRFKFLSSCYVDRLLANHSVTDDASVDLLSGFSSEAGWVSRSFLFVQMFFVRFIIPREVNELLTVDVLRADWLKGSMFLLVIHRLGSHNDLCQMLGVVRIHAYYNRIRTDAMEGYYGKLIALNLAIGSVSIGLVLLSGALVDLYEAGQGYLGFESSCLIAENEDVRWYRTVLLIWLAVVGSLWMRCSLQQLIRQAHDFLKDDKYLIGRKLLNMNKLTASVGQK